MLLQDFYEVVEFKKADDSLLISVNINKTHNIFIGHFPNNPVTPGVALLQIIKNCIEIHFRETFIMQKTSQVKFLSLVDPNVENLLYFNIQIQSENECIKIKNHTSFKDGRSVLKCNATFVKYPHQ